MGGTVQLATVLNLVDFLQIYVKITERLACAELYIKGRMATLQFSEGSDTPTVLHRKKQLLPNIVDGIAKIRPEAIYAEIPRSRTSYESGYRKITYKDLANAINGVAWLLEKHLGRGKKQETLAYIGPNDLGYIFMVLGAVKAGYKVCAVVSLNNAEEHASNGKTIAASDLHTPNCFEPHPSAQKHRLQSIAYAGRAPITHGDRNPE